MRAKCPHCNGILEFEFTRLAPARQEGKTADFGHLARLTVWTATPSKLSDWLIDLGVEGNLARFGDLDRMVLRTAFRTSDYIKAHDLIGDPNTVREAIRAEGGRLPGWIAPTGRQSVFGIQGRWWTRSGYAPGVIPVDDLDEEELV